MKRSAKTPSRLSNIPFVHTAKFVAVLSDAIKNEPPVKAAIVGLVQAAEAAIGDVSIAAATKGADIPEDLKAVTDIESFFVYFTNSFLPAIESAWLQDTGCH